MGKCGLSAEADQVAPAGRRWFSPVPGLNPTVDYRDSLGTGYWEAFCLDRPPMRIFHLPSDSLPVRLEDTEGLVAEVLLGVAQHLDRA